MARPRAPILVTGFEPFGEDAVNPSWQLAQALEGVEFAGRRVEAALLPVTFAGSLQTMRSALRRFQPSLVLAIGLAGGRDKLSLERVAINIDDARIPDNAGQQPIDRAIVGNGPAAYFSRLPIKAMLAALRAAGIPAEISQSAGTYVCNHVFYGLMHALRAQPRTRAGFIHVPRFPEHASPPSPSLAMATQLAGIRLVLEVAARTRRDISVGAGAEH